jgi:hypothetical protein
MTMTELPTTAPYRAALCNLYRDIHKGIRAELFALTVATGSTDPADAAARRDLAAQAAGVAAVLELHAEHEDGVIQPAIEQHLPAQAERIEADHAAFDRRAEGLVELAAATAGAPAGDRRRLAELLHLDTAAFTSAHLAHQDLEERVVMPALEDALGVDAVVAMHQAIVGSIPPEEMARSLAFMLPAMNLDDRCELLGGMRAAAPPEAFDGVWSLTRSVLCPPDVAALAARLEVG